MRQSDAHETLNVLKKKIAVKISCQNQLSKSAVPTFESSVGAIVDSLGGIVNYRVSYCDTPEARCMEPGKYRNRACGTRVESLRDSRSYLRGI